MCIRDSHAGVAVALAILVYLQLEHLLLGDVVGDHPLGGTLGSQLGQVVGEQNRG